MLRPEELSKLPQDQAYWSGLEARIVAAAREDRANGGLAAWHAPLARGAWVLASAAAAAVLALTFIPREAEANTSASAVPALLAPSAATAATLDPMLRMESAPAIADLLRSQSTGAPR